MTPINEALAYAILVMIFPLIMVYALIAVGEKYISQSKPPRDYFEGGPD